MKRFYYLVILTSMLIFTSSALNAQYSFQRGGLGYGAIGYGYGQISNLEATLQDFDLTCTYCNTPQSAINLGGGGFGLFNKRFILEGKLYGQFYENSESENTLIKTTAGYVFVDLGFAVVNQDGWLVYPAVGFGLNAYTMKIKNKTDNSLYFGDNKLYPDTQTDFRAGFPMLEAKVGVNKLLKDMGRILIGLDVGVQFNVASGDWMNTETNEIVNDIDQTGFTGVFVNLTIGGGKFLMGEKSKMD